MVGGCEHFIPLARGELVDLLCADPALPADAREPFRALCDRVSAIHHGEYHRWLQELKRSYAPFDPDTDAVSLAPPSAGERQERLNALYKDLSWLLERAHFHHLGRDEMSPALGGASAWGVRMDVDFGAFEHAAIFVRGATAQKRTLRRLRTLFQPEEVEVPIYRRLVLVLKLRPHPRLTGPVDTQSVHLKIFKDIAQQDVLMLLPGARVRLTGFDQGKLGFSLLGGMGMAVWNVLRDVTVTLEQALSTPNTMWGLAAGGVGYGYKTFYGYRQTKQRYHLTLTQSLYFQNLDSNAGVLTRLLDEAEEQDSRLAILAYYCLWRYGGADGWTAADLDASIEVYLDRYADVPILCQNGAALAQLRKLHLIEESAGRFRALPPVKALAALAEPCDNPTRPAELPAAGRGRQGPTS